MGRDFLLLEQASATKAPRSARAAGQGRAARCAFLEPPAQGAYPEDQPEAAASVSPDRELGRGRSGVVYASHDDTGKEIVRKVFGAGGMTKVVQYALLGAPNPYAWNEPAVRTAVLRRKIAAELVEFWFGKKLRVARAMDHAFNPDHRTFEMRCELIQGRHVALCHAPNPMADAELRDLTGNIMKPLQTHLIEAGLDGLVWQAGLGNPVALNNFMRENNPSGETAGWVWIDLESGVPALIPINPWDLVRFYLPKSLRHCGPLFDDIDVPKLRNYVANQSAALEQSLSIKRFHRLCADIDSLRESQTEWKSLPRFRRSIAYQLVRGSITAEQAKEFASHPARWYGRELVRASRSLPRRVGGLATTAITALARLDIGRFLKGCWDVARSQSYRERLARDYVARRIAYWTKRGQLRSPEADGLRHRLDGEETSAYLTDFSTHVAIKPLVKLAQFWIVPALWMAGAVDSWFMALFMIAGGCMVRTLYTLWRIIQNAIERRERPWVALGVGVIPVLGNLAFPLQIIFSGSKEDRAIARFILFDTFSRFGQWFPIWGGPDTLTEHVFNRMPKLILRSRASRAADPAAAPEPCSDSPAPRASARAAFR